MPLCENSPFFPLLSPELLGVPSVLTWSLSRLDLPRLGWDQNAHFVSRILPNSALNVVSVLVAAAGSKEKPRTAPFHKPGLGHGPSPSQTPELALSAECVWELPGERRNERRNDQSIFLRHTLELFFPRCTPWLV